MNAKIELYVEDAYYKKDRRITMAEAKIDQKGSSKMHRLQVGDVVSFSDTSEWPPVHMEGPIKSFTNEEMTYLEVEFEGGTKELTEDEVTRVA